MDVNKNIKKKAEELELNEYNVPLCDYNEKGQVKPVRRRVLKKLMSYEYKAIFVWLIPIIIAMAFIGLLSVILSHLGFGFDSDEFSIIYFLTLYFLGIGNFIVVIIPLGVGSTRYRRNFFSAEGYLTMSIPASCDEHLLGKHIPMFLTTLLSIFASAVINFLTILFTRGSGVIFEILFSVELGGMPFVDALFLTLTLIFWVINCVLAIGVITVGQGVINGLTRRYSKQKGSLVLVAIFFGLYYGMSFLLILFEVMVISFQYIFTPIGLFVQSLLLTVIFTWLIRWFYKIERDNLSVKLNLF